ncbi:MAG: ADP-ribosylglycohydrolase family protein, partial [Pseudomonadales bacterium]|nr:ADP-ribosylglycohydrolase family protein [Pseudomonadales bacterium]
MDALTSARKRAVAALQSMFVADALAMPVHWYYNPMDIFRQFRGGITGFEDAPDHHPSSIMSLHSTSHGGRGPRRNHEQAEIVGDVILKGKREFWEQSNVHYHQGMKAGENTLNAHCARALIHSLIANDGRYDQNRFLDSYIELMTADPAQHP